ncbi:aldehyde dehydrogenase family protein [Pedobacter immunditicola]|uniref:aldehyde dehydrogenase family protein n=1 Tax=Pedobacter immunditicola TaxID=3133440 RepID=UPI0030A8B67A
MKTIEKEFEVNKVSNSVTNPPALNWINGDWVDSGNHQLSFNPATGETIGRYADGGLEEAKMAIAAALKSFRETPWKNDHALRAKVLLNMADRIENRSSDFIQILGTEGGKIAAEAGMEVQAAPAFLRYWAGKTFTAGRSGEVMLGSFSFTLREAVGVAGLIIPFNAPLALLLRALAPALAAGTTTVIKMPGLAAQTNSMLAGMFSEVAHLPKGVINIITESGAEVAKYLVQSPDVPVISFTGSTATGKAILAAGATQLKRLNLELGGKTPMLVFGDADMEKAIDAIVSGITIFSGQFCMAGSRILVQSNIAESLRMMLGKRLAAIKVGPPSNPQSEMGPLINKSGCDRVNQMVEEAIAAGAKIIVRGGPLTEAAYNEGTFYSPTLLEVTDSKLPIVQQEIFGPVATLQIFKDEAEAIVLANDSDYGLAASIWTRDFNRSWWVAKEIQAGTIWINTYAQVFPQFEEGGYKKSGIGRLNGEAALEDFLEYKHISFNQE